MTVKLGINGFGRIGRQVFRIAHETPGIEVVAINDLYDTDTLVHLLKYDSNYGKFDAEVEVRDGNLVVDGRTISVTAEKDPAALRWGERGADIIVDATGVFRDGKLAARHLEAGAKRVIIAAPGKNVDYTIVLGVNEDGYDPEQHYIVSNASCTTNCLAPIAKVLDDNFTIKRGMMTTVHAYTNGQAIVDLPHKDLRRARAAGLSIIPTTTGAAKAIGEVLPHLRGKLTGMAMRVPTSTVSIVDLTVELEQNVDIDTVNQAFVDASEGSMKNILGVSEEPLVSVDYKGDCRSSIVDLLSTEVIDGNLVKVLSWYDNEWGYSCRVVDLAIFMGNKGL